MDDLTGPTGDSTRLPTDSPEGAPGDVTHVPEPLCLASGTELPAFPSENPWDLFPSEHDTTLTPASAVVPSNGSMLLRVPSDWSGHDTTFAELDPREGFQVPGTAFQEALSASAERLVGLAHSTAHLLSPVRRYARAAIERLPSPGDRARSLANPLRSLGSHMRPAAHLLPSLHLSPRVLSVLAGSVTLLVLFLFLSLPGRLAVWRTPPPEKPQAWMAFDVALPSANPAVLVTNTPDAAPVAINVVIKEDPPPKAAPPVVAPPSPTLSPGRAAPQTPPSATVVRTVLQPRPQPPAPVPAVASRLETTFAAAMPPPPAVPPASVAAPPADGGRPATSASDAAAGAPADVAAGSRVEAELAALAARPRSAAVRNVINQYRDAFNALDPAAARAVWPSVDTAALGRAFSQIHEQSFAFDDCRISVIGQRAVASCKGTLRYVPKLGNRQASVERRQWEFNLREVGEGWSIETVATR